MDIEEEETDWQKQLYEIMSVAGARGAVIPLMLAYCNDQVATNANTITDTVCGCVCKRFYYACQMIVEHKGKLTAGMGTQVAAWNAVTEDNNRNPDNYAQQFSSDAMIEQMEDLLSNLEKASRDMTILEIPHVFAILTVKEDIDEPGDFKFVTRTFHYGYEPRYAGIFVARAFFESEKIDTVFAKLDEILENDEKTKEDARNLIF